MCPDFLIFKISLISWIAVGFAVFSMGAAWEALFICTTYLGLDFLNEPF